MALLSGCSVPSLHGRSKPAAHPWKNALHPHQADRSRVHAGAPAVAERATAPLPKEDLMAYIASGCKSRGKWRIGTEHEKIGFNLTDNSRLTYAQIDGLLQQLAKRFGWSPILEAGKLVGAALEGKSVTLEAGGQLELSGAPVEDIHQTCAELHSHLHQVKSICEEMDAGFLALGFDPKWAIQNVPVVPKRRNEIVTAYLRTVGSKGVDMLYRSCSVQVNLDYESERDMVEKFQIGLALQPVATALSACSPFVEGEPSGYLSTRGHMWTDVDNQRSGGLPFVFEPGMGFERYVDWVLDVPMYFVYRDGRFINACGQSFRDFMAGKLPALPGEYPNMADFTNHLSTVYPDVRLKTFLEMRGADAGPWPMLCAIPALWVGMLYDRQAQSEALAMTSDWTPEERDYLRREGPKYGLRTPFRGGTLQDVAKDTLKIAKGGLQRRGLEEETFLSRLEVIADTGLTQADHLLALYETKWKRSVDPLYKEFAY